MQTKSSSTATADFSVQNEGTIFLVRSNNEAARQHLSENVQDDAQWFGGALVVEHRYIADLVSALQGNGFSVE